jgi:hypothetical protein
MTQDFESTVVLSCREKSPKLRSEDLLKSPISMKSDTIIAVHHSTGKGHQIVNSNGYSGLRFVSIVVLKSSYINIVLRIYS